MRVHVIEIYVGLVTDLRARSISHLRNYMMDCHEISFAYSLSPELTFYMKKFFYITNSQPCAHAQRSAKKLFSN